MGFRTSPQSDSHQQCAPPVVMDMTRMSFAFDFLAVNMLRSARFMWSPFQVWDRPVCLMLCDLSQDHCRFSTVAYVNPHRKVKPLAPMREVNPLLFAVP